MKEEITLNELLPNQFYINENGDMVAEISLKQINQIADILTNYYKENERLNNIINELEKWLNERKLVYNITREDRDIDYTIIEVLDKLQELKDSDKE